MRCLVLIVLCAALITPSAASALVPTIANPGFEEVVPGNDSPGWGWYTRAAASYHSSATDPHSGNRCLVFVNDSSLAPEVYARLYQGVGILPGIEYELSVWVRGEGVATGTHFTDWSSYQLNIPDGTYDWKRVSTRFRAGEGQTGVNIGINIVNVCKELAIDDISLRPVGTPLRGGGFEGSVIIPGQVQGDDAAALLAVSVEAAPQGSTLEATVLTGDQVLFRGSESVKPGSTAVEWKWNTGAAAVRNLDCRVRVLDSEGLEIASASRTIEKLSTRVISADLDAVERKFARFLSLYASCRAHGIPLDYPTVTRTLVEQFIPLTRRDLTKGEERRADFAVKDLSRSLDGAMAEMRACLDDPKVAPIARRYRTSRMDIEGISFVADRRDVKGKKDRGPVFFCGYGHFSQVRKDIPRFPGYGVNIIQIEVGPAITLPTADEVSLKAARDVAAVLDNAAKHNVKVNVLLSPHYFPTWAMEKWPKLGAGGGGFLGFCVDEPEAKQVIEKFLRAVIPIIGGKPALHSFCLSNESMFDRGQGCEITKQMWPRYLQKVHGDVATMNKLYGTGHSDFAAVPIPGNGDFGAPQFYDYCIFNQDRFAGWHQWMADVIHEMAPGVPIHAKVMAWTLLQRHNVAWGIDAEKFSDFSQINGNDCIIWGREGGGWALGWHGQNMMYDLQRSVGRKPIFNSENHLTLDGSTYYLPGEHFRTALWQGAIHGQGATTIWVWDRAADRDDPAYVWSAPFYGNVMDRPGCAEAVGRTCLDLNRFADEVTALQNAKSPVAIVFSMASLIHSPRYPDAAGRAYTALNFCGVNVDFISERQLAAGKGKDYSMIVLPEVTHLPRAAFDALARVGIDTRLVVIGEGPQKDPYGSALDQAAVRFVRDSYPLPADADSEKQMWPFFIDLLEAAHALPEVRVVDAKTGEPVWGVEWLAAKVGDRQLVNVVDLLSRPVNVKLISRRNVIYERLTAEDPVLEAADLLSLGGKSKVETLLPMVPVLAQIAQ
ncbi:MAG: beta-galactosidase [Armatimonadetes bacterium]|nr:beta-galactosidase [Armatimonadota bacterium]